VIYRARSRKIAQYRAISRNIAHTAGTCRGGCPSGGARDVRYLTPLWTNGTRVECKLKVGTRAERPIPPLCCRHRRSEPLFAAEPEPSPLPRRCRRRPLADAAIALATAAEPEPSAAVAVSTAARAPAANACERAPPHSGESR